MSAKAKLYEVIINYLEKQIADGMYNNGIKLPSEADLSKLFNVSRITAQRALDELELKGIIYRKRGSGSYLVENAKSFSGTENLQAFAVHEKNIAFILPYEILGGRFSEIIQNASNVLEKYGYNMMLYNSKTNMMSERELIRKLVAADVNGVILYPQHDLESIDLLYDIWLKKFPFVVIDKKITDIPICSVYSDNFTGSYLLTKELIKNGHTKIACFYYMDINFAEVFSIRQRFFGYCTALHESNVTIENNHIINFHEKASETKTRASVLRGLLDSGVTAILTQNDYEALDLIAVCNKINIDIPGQLSIVGFDNIPQSEYSNPSLTTAEQDFSAIGKSAAEAVIAQIENKPYAAEQIIPVSIICRNSIKRL